MHGMGNYTVILNSIPDVGKKKKAIVVDQSLLGDCCLQKKSWNWVYQYRLNCYRNKINRNFNVFWAKNIFQREIQY